MYDEQRAGCSSAALPGGNLTSATSLVNGATLRARHEVWHFLWLSSPFSEKSQLPPMSFLLFSKTGLRHDNSFLLARLATMYARSTINSPLKILRDLWLKKRYAPHAWLHTNCFTCPWFYISFGSNSNNKSQIARLDDSLSYNLSQICTLNKIATICYENMFLKSYLSLKLTQIRIKHILKLIYLLIFILQKKVSLFITIFIKSRTLCIHVHIFYFDITIGVRTYIQI